MGKSYYVENGDKRMDFCRRYLLDNGFTVTDDIFNSDYIILPFKARAGEYAGKIKSSQTVFVYDKNKFSAEFNCISYRNSAFTECNSRLTAQGVLHIILENIERHISETSVLVLGYGSCGTAICELMKKLDVSVACYARRAETLTQIKIDGVTPQEKLTPSISRFDIIINTAPSNILSDEILSALTENNIYIEVASEPYGFDISKANKYNFRFIPAAGLPGKYTPISAGEAIARAVVGITEEDGYE